MKFSGFHSSQRVGLGMEVIASSPYTTTPASLLTLKSQGTAPILASQRSGSSTSEQFQIVQAESSAFTTGRGTSSGIWANIIESRNSNLILTSFLAGGTGGKIILDADNVGIGTTAPATKLDVTAGNVRLSNDYVIEWGGTKARIGGSNTGDFLKFFTNDTVRMYVKSDGNVGIGTSFTAPSAKLDIVESASYTPCIELNAPHAIIKCAGAPGAGYMGMGASYMTGQVAGMFFRSDNTPICWGAAGSSTTHMTLLANGNLGIGTAAPAAQLHIIGPSAASSPYISECITIAPSNIPARTLQLRYDDGGSVGNAFSFAYAGTRAMMIVANGNFGIGNNSSPTQALEIYKAGNDTQMLVHAYGGSDNTTQAGIWFRTDNSSAATYARSKGAVIFQRTGSYGVGKLHLAVQSNANSSSAAVGDAKLTIIQDGNVGIGATSPSSKLHVTGAPGNSTYLSYLFNSASHTQAHGLNVQIASSNEAAYGLRVNTGGDTNALAVMGNGEVGIGTYQPGYKLDVRGWTSIGDTTNGGFLRLEGKGGLGYAVELRTAPHSGLYFQSNGVGGPVFNTYSKKNSFGVGITPKAILHVAGAIIVGNVNEDPHITKTYGGSYTNANAYTIDFTSGVTNTTGAGDYVTVTWDKDSWSAVSWEATLAQNGGSYKVVGGFYHNGSGTSWSGNTSVTVYNGTTLSDSSLWQVSTTSGQPVAWRFWIAGGGHHPHIHMKVTGSGAATPKPEDFTVVWTDVA